MIIPNDWIHPLVRFYEILDMLAERIGGPRPLAHCTGRMGYSKREVYFFREYGEGRSDTGSGKPSSRCPTPRDPDDEDPAGRLDL